MLILWVCNVSLALCQKLNTFPMLYSAWRQHPRHCDRNFLPTKLSANLKQMLPWAKAKSVREWKFAFATSPLALGNHCLPFGFGPTYILPANQPPTLSNSEYNISVYFFGCVSPISSCCVDSCFRLFLACLAKWLSFSCLSYSCLFVLFFSVCLFVCPILASPLMPPCLSPGISECRPPTKTSAVFVFGALECRWCDAVATSISQVDFFGTLLLVSVTHYNTIQGATSLPVCVIFCTVCCVQSKFFCTTESPLNWEKTSQKILKWGGLLLKLSLQATFSKELQWELSVFVFDTENPLLYLYLSFSFANCWKTIRRQLS